MYTQRIRLKRLVVAFMALSCAACFSTPEPPALLQFVSFTKKTYGYDFEFTSDTDFFATYWVRGRRPVVVRWLVCSLDDDTNFAVDHTLKRFMRGSIEPVLRHAVDQRLKFSYTTHLNFSVTNDQGTSDDDLSSQEVNRLLADRTTIPCKVVMTIYLSKPYYSKTMHVPAKALLDAVTVHQ
jgi:hypothetical protein